MPAMFPENRILPKLDQGGFGLIAVLFAVVFLALFGVLAARFLATTAISSSEDYLWTQTLYAAESTAHRVILFHDGGGGGALVLVPPLVVQNITTVVNVDTFVAAGTPASLEVEGLVPTMNIRRIIQVRYLL